MRFRPWVRMSFQTSGQLYLRVVKEATLATLISDMIALGTFAAHRIRSFF